MTFQLYDLRLKAYFGIRVPMTEESAALANRDLLLSGKTGIGWKAVDREEKPRRKAPLAPAPPKPTPPAGLVDALVSLGYRKGDAKREAARFDGGTIEDALRQIMVTV